MNEEDHHPEHDASGVRSSEAEREAVNLEAAGSIPVVRPPVGIRIPPLVEEILRTLIAVRPGERIISFGDDYDGDEYDDDDPDGWVGGDFTPPARA